MNLIEKSELKKEIHKIVYEFYDEINDEKTRKEIAFRIKDFLEKQKIEWKTLNLYTPPHKVDSSGVDIKIDDDLYEII
jgi:hypothetical protein